MSKLFLKSFWIVFTKEVADALRDRRTLLRLLVPAVLMGPLLLLALSTLISSLEQRAEKRVVLVVGIEHAPSLRNFLEPTRSKPHRWITRPSYAQPGCWSPCW